MAFTIPNLAVASFTPQAQIDSVDIDILAAAVGGRSGVSSGCAVTAQGSPDNTVAVASGTVVVAGTEAVVSSGNVTMTAAHGSLPRFDFVSANNAGTKAYTAGTAAASPVFPAIPANSVVLAAIYVPANDNIINSTQIVDKRVTVPSPVTSSSWTTVKKASDTIRNNTTTFTDDPVLVFAMASNKTYAIRGMVRWSALLASDYKWTLSGPASPTRILIRTQTFNATTGAETATFQNAYGTSVPQASSADQEDFARFEAVITNGGTAGNFAYQWAQNTAVAENTITRAGSYIEYMQVD